MARPAAWRLAAAALAIAASAPLAAGAGTNDPAGPTAEPPPTDLVRQEVARQAGRLWRVESVELAPAAAEGGGARRFTARLSLTEPTFTVVGRDGPFTLVAPVAERGMEKILLGTVRAGRAADGSWTLSLDPANGEVLESLGRPQAELPGRPLLAGSEEARALAGRRQAEAEAGLAEEQARRRRAEALLAERSAAEKAEAERAAADARAVAARTRQIAEFRNRLAATDRSAVLAAFDAAIGGNDMPLRQLALEAALRSPDPIVANVALRDWLARRKDLPVQLYATREDQTSEQVLRNLGPLTLSLDAFNPASGAMTGTLGAPGYSIARPSAATGTLAGRELTVHSYGCSLTLRLTEHASLDGLYRCQSLPALIARIALD